MPVCHSKCMNASNDGDQTEEDHLGKANAVKPSNKSAVSKSLKPSSKSRSATSKSSLKVVPSRHAKMKHGLTSNALVASLEKVSTVRGAAEVPIKEQDDAAGNDQDGEAPASTLGTHVVMPVSQNDGHLSVLNEE
ncbi:hypothetical protein BS17DRAFT_822449 [Gyrodon lividus]|nr:hypothetical protein BS17DRAFT_822449 [Gyrodon lividus]